MYFEYTLCNQHHDREHSPQLTLMTSPDAPLRIETVLLTPPPNASENERNQTEKWIRWRSKLSSKGQRLMQIY